MSLQIEPCRKDGLMFERISRRERYDLIIAWFALSVAFSMIFFGGIGSYGSPHKISFETYLTYLVISMITVGVGFVLHELAHKFTAMRYGYWAEFRKDNIMLLVAVIVAVFLGIVFAAPGATMISGTGITSRQNGKISAAGPLTNLLLCIPFALIRIASGSLGLATSSQTLLSLIGIVGLQVNAMFAAFNMLPVSVLDGKKVLAWNPAVFVVLFVASFGILIAIFYPLIL